MLTRRQVIGGAAGLGLLGVVLGGGAYFLHKDRAASAAKLLALTLPDLAGVPVTLDQWQGKLLVVNFWATWCAPCREEMPEFVRAQSMHGAKGLQFVGIGIDEASKLRQFATSIGVNYPILVGGYSVMELSRTLGNSAMALPFTVVVGRRGQIELTQLGPLNSAQLDSIVSKLS